VTATQSRGLNLRSVKRRSRATDRPADLTVLCDASQMVDEICIESCYGENINKKQLNIFPVLQPETLLIHYVTCHKIN
jgi:hypothetical protein